MKDIKKIQEFFSKPMKESLTGGFPYKKTSGEDFERIDIAEPMDNATRDRMIKNFRAAGWDAKPSNRGGIVAIKRAIMEAKIEYLNPGKRPIITNKQGEKFVLQGFATSGYYLIPYNGKKYWEHFSVPKNQWISEKNINWSDYNFSEEQFNNLKASNLNSKKEIDKKFQDMNEAESEDPVDTITMDVPLFIRMLEYSREDAQEDMDLHDVAEKAILLNKEKGILSMEDYNEIVGKAEEIKEGMGNEVGDKVYFKGDMGEKYPSSQGYYGIIEDTTPARNYNMMATYDVVVYDKNDNEIRTITTDFTNLTTKKVNEASDYMKRRKSQDDYAVNKKDKPKKSYNPTPSGKTDYMKRREKELAEAVFNKLKK